MAEQNKPEGISSEELLDIKKSLQEVIVYYQANALKTAIEDETAILIPVRATIQDVLNDNRAIKTTLDDYENFDLDNVKVGKDLNTTQTFSEVGDISGNFTVTPDVYEESKEQTDFYMKAIDTQQSNQDRELTEEAPAGINFNPSGTKDRIQQENLGKEKYKGSHQNELLKKCAPCLERQFNATRNLLIDPQYLENIANKYIRKWDLYKKYLRSLLYNDDIINDLCNLINALNEQCVPDLAAVIALFGLIAFKTIDISNFSGLPLMGLVSPIFNPILGGITSILDRYIALIMGPVECFADSLTNIITKLDLEQGYRDYKGEEERYRIHKARELESRRDQINLKLAKLQRERRIINLKPDQNQELLIENENKIKEIGFDVNDEIIPNGQYDRILKEIEAERLEARALRKERNNAEPTNFQDAKKVIKEGKTAIGDSLKFVRDKILEYSLDMRAEVKKWITEAESFLNLKVDTGFSQLEAAHNLQRISRVMTIMKTLITVLSTDKKICKDNSDPKNFLGSFIGRSNNNTLPQVVTGEIDGVSQLVTLPADTILQIYGGDEPQSFDEIKNYNKSGLIPDVGNLADKQITAIIPETQTNITPTIVPLDLCGKKGDPDAKKNIKDWISELNV